jgi:hypothetical protein
MGVTSRAALFDRIIRTTDPTLWRMVRLLIAAVAGVHVLLTVGWVALAAAGRAVPVLAVTIIGWGMPLIATVIPAVYAASLVGTQAGSDAYSLLHLTEITPREMVTGYYHGIQRRLRAPLRSLLMVMLLLALMRSFGMVGAISAITPYMVCISVILPLMFVLVYVDYLNLFAIAMGLWTGLRFRKASTALALTMGLTLGVPIVLITLTTISVSMSRITSIVCVIACGSAALLFIAPLALHDRLLQRAERWV